MFSFKQFDVHDEACAMKVGTDGVLLGAWADVEGDSSILDVGTGSGLVALMVAQRNAKALITALDIEPGAVCQAVENVERSGWAGRISVVEGDVRSYSSEQKFDHIVSNPPYFADALHSPDSARTMARHTSSLSFDELVASAIRLLRAEGRLSVVLPTEAASVFRRVAFGRLHLTRLMDVATRCGDEPKRTLMEFRATAATPMPRCRQMTIHAADGSYTEQYRRLTEEFYLKF